MLANKLMSALPGGASDKLYVDDVFSTHLYTGNGATQTITNGIDLAGTGGMVWIKCRSAVAHHSLLDTQRGFTNRLSSSLVNAQSDWSAYGPPSVTSSGFVIGTTGFSDTNKLNDTHVAWTFRKAPKFFDVVTYTGTGNTQTIVHNLGVKPGMILVKCLTAGYDWYVWHNGLSSLNYLYLNSTAGQAYSSGNPWISEPTASLFQVGGFSAVQLSGQQFVAYLFAHDPSADGIIKCAHYTGNGTTQTINCGFSTGARFILIKCTNSTGDWYVWDSARGIVAANDPHLSLNTAAAEVTTDDSVDPANSGFIVNQVAATNINVTGGSYIFLAISSG